MESGSDRNTHLVGDLCGTTAELERHIDMHHIHTLERCAEQRVTGLGELHELFSRHPGNERNLVHSCGIFRGANTYEPHMMPLSLQFSSPLQGRIGRAIALVAHGIHHQSDGQRAVNALFNPVFAHCFIVAVTSGGRVRTNRKWYGSATFAQ